MLILISCIVCFVFCSSTVLCRPIIYPSSVADAEHGRLSFGKFGVNAPDQNVRIDMFFPFRDKGSGSTVAAGTENQSWSPDEFERVLEAIGKALLQCRNVDEVDKFLERSRELVLKALQARSTATTASEDDDNESVVTTTLAPCRTTPQPRRCRHRRPRDMQLDARGAARTSDDPSDSDSEVELNYANQPRSGRARTATKRGRQWLFQTSSDQEREQSNDTAEPSSTQLQETTAADLDSTTLAAVTTADSTTLAAVTTADSTTLAAVTTADSTTLAAETTAGPDATSMEKASEVQVTGRGKMQNTNRNKDPLLRFWTVGTAATSKKSAPPYLLIFDENGVAHGNDVFLIHSSGVVRTTKKM